MADTHPSSRLEPEQRCLAMQKPKRCLFGKQMLPVTYLPEAICTQHSDRVQSCFHSEAANLRIAAVSARGVHRADSNNDPEEMPRHATAETLLRRASTSTRSKPNCLLSQPSV